MGATRNSRRQELAQLQLQLEIAGRLLDEIESRSCKKTIWDQSKSKAVRQNTNPIPGDAETRFAACVASGMSKIRSEHDKGSSDKG